jgi:hypothetical protein
MFNVNNLTIACASEDEISSPEPVSRMTFVERELLMVDDGALVRTRLVDVDLGNGRK